MTNSSTAAALGALLVLLAGLAGCGGGGGAAATPDAPAANDAAIATARPGELLGYVKGKLLSRAAQAGGLPAVGDAPEWLDSVASVSGAVMRSGTLVQEAGVDEDDLIKTDGSRIYTLQPQPWDGSAGAAFARLAIYTLDANGRPLPAGELSLHTREPAFMLTRGMLLDSDAQRLAVLGEGTADTLALPDCPPDQACITQLLPYRPSAPRVHLQLLDVRQPAALPDPERWEIDGQLVGVRQVGHWLYLVTAHAPDFAFERLPPTVPDSQRQAALDALTVAEVLPSIRINGGAAQPLVGETECWLQPANGSLQLAVTTLTAIDLSSPTYARTSRCFVGGTEALYMSPASVYLATTRDSVQTVSGRPTFAPEMRTDLHKFAVSGADIAYRGSGSIRGHLGWDRAKAPYRMSEHDGDLRVLGFTGSFGWFSAADAASVAASPATLSVLRERDGSLQTIGTLPNAQRPAPIGKPGEQVYAVRFAGARAYVVTFRQTDPLYVLDLTDPADPRSAGELEVPGFSDWLFPLDGGLLFGVGKDASVQGQVQGVKVALFDVGDVSRPRLLDTASFGGRGSTSALDYSAHGMSLAVAGSGTRLALPMLVAEAGSALPVQRLQRFEVDHGARSLAVEPPIELGRGWADIGNWRSLQIGGQLHLLRDGRLETWPW